MKIDIVFPEFFTWMWSSSYGLVNAAERAGILNKEVNISMCSEREILELGDTDADMILFWGGGEHSPRLHDTLKKREMLKSITIPKACVVIESFDYDALDQKQFPTIHRHMSEVISRRNLFSHIFPTDENDVERLKPYSNSHIEWLPMHSDIAMFTPKATEIMTSEFSFVGSLYGKRQILTDELKKHGLLVESMRVEADEPVIPPKFRGV